jgi:hypothetical protein
MTPESGSELKSPHKSSWIVLGSTLRPPGLEAQKPLSNIAKALKFERSHRWVLGRPSWAIILSKFADLIRSVDRLYPRYCLYLAFPIAQNH